MLQLAARAQQDQIQRRSLLSGDVTALEHALAAGLHGNVLEQRHGLAAQGQQRRAVGAFQRRHPSPRGFLRVCRPHHVQVRDHAETGDRFHRLVRRAILADTHAVVRENVDDRQVRQRRQADARAAVIREHQERRAARAEDTVRGDAVEHGAHAVFADAEGNIAARPIFRREIVVACLQVADVVQRGAVEVGAAADQQRRDLGQRLQHVLARLARGDLGVRRKLGDGGKQRTHVRRFLLRLLGHLLAQRARYL